MKRRFLPYTLVVIGFGLSRAYSAPPSAEQALQLKPMQVEVEYDRPTGDEIASCKIAPEEEGDETAWVVRGPSGSLLRRFVDSNRDSKVDQWRYYRNGVEVYRDIDENFNGKSDQYRWLGTAGTRWGLDVDEDGNIDQWKLISAEEVTSEVVAAIRTRDQARFDRVLLRTDELTSLGLSKGLASTLVTKITAASKSFKEACTSQKLIRDDTTWIDFGGLRPGTIPAGTDGSAQDVTVYENVVAMVETSGAAKQVPIGTMVQVAGGWRVVDLPIAAGEDAAPQFVFFEATSQPNLDIPATAGITQQVQKLVEELEKIDKQLGETRTPAALSELNGRRADILEQLAKAAEQEADRDMWWMQFADTVGAAAQSGAYPEGTKRLADLSRELARNSNNTDLIAHVTFAFMSATYAERLQDERADFAKVQEDWLQQLDAFVTQFPESRDTAEAILQLALAREFAGEDDAANQWYTKIINDFRDAPLSAKAAGAKRRLESVGKPLELRGNTVDGKTFDLSRQRGNVVLVHYWATWCQPCKQDMDVLASLQKKFARQKFQIVGVNVDSDSGTLADYLRSERPKWTHLYEEGGLDSRLANEMGVFTLPIMLLVDQRGNVVNRQIHSGELEAEIEKLLK